MLKGTPMQSGGTIGSNLRKTGSVGLDAHPPSSKNKPQPKLERPFSIFYLRFSIADSCGHLRTPIDTQSADAVGPNSGGT